ncbi:Phage small terminase subunit [Achromobacter insolitus]|uniref:phage terminase small subunit n=1 Tax=Achromobacter insolitus TaxID=217204 RepID=UPI0009728CFB|nr:phage terminase small subunit [Achromobacter insolitus]APX77283.1 hypothetical protein BUW96_22235 [Achromobacter insolitus]CAB3678320.1 hypothetical protein LMG6003_01463 [Achromobacter insolitus]VEG72327.1 Phage small terminase subunit [Achromobacter insolitus]
MASLAQAHFLRVRAQRTAAPLAAGAVPAGSPYALMMAALTEDARRLKSIESVERKIEAKRGMLATYAPYLDGVLAANAGGADEVVTTLMVWHLDVCDFLRGLDLATYVLAHDLPLPERYARKVPALLLDEVSEAVLDERVPKDFPTLQALQRVAELVYDRDAPDEARAKLHRAIGLTMAELAGPEPKGDRLQMAVTALRQLERAVSLNGKVGAKKDIEQLQRTIKKAEANAAT